MYKTPIVKQSRLLLLLLGKIAQSKAPHTAGENEFEKQVQGKDFHLNLRLRAMN